ncbi:hypothetical protein CLOSTHATH_01516 [Hungatella hathewayi DSM 13479]|uniref:Uncharacterized protein n=1 Tax=Hungatella hathewayi DSM 13479 TaxID=566550 RepID=D3AD38_9FIRM|nr:hypothetical protein CLOSTHATH_01516 [Hungatella hathewayi DSM 13479]
MGKWSSLTDRAAVLAALYGSIFSVRSTGSHLQSLHRGSIH